MRLVITSWPRFLIFVAIVAGIVVVAVAGVLYVTGRVQPTDTLNAPSPEQQVVLPTAPRLASPPSAPLRALVVQRDTKQQTKKVLTCGQQGCRPIPQPDEAQGDAVTDGEYWYYYTEEEDNKSKETIRTLLRSSIADGTSTTIVAQTPLVRPRDLIISPDGTKVAYWLDNIDNPKKQLTELWVYDAKAGGTHVVAEKLVRTDLVTPVRWSRDSSHLWFVVNSGSTDEEKLEYLVITLQPPGAAAQFSQLDWTALKDVAAGGAMDISSDGQSIAYGLPDGNGQTQLVVVPQGEDPQTTNVRGNIPYVQWLEDGSLVYAVQDAAGPPAGSFAFWRLQDGVHSFVARRDGVLRSAHGDVRGEYVMFITSGGQPAAQLYALQLASGHIEEQASVPALGQTLALVHVDQEQAAAAPNVAGIQTYDDAELAAFVEKNLPDIVGQTAAKPTRIVMTDLPNTVYVDWQTGGDQETRVLLDIKDVTHPEWSIRARYEPAGGEWRKIQGGGLSDPEPVKVYEWEDELERWILKQQLQEL